MYCRNCGNEIAEGSRFCSSCGSPVEIAPKPEITEPNVYAGAMTGIEEEPVIPRKPIFEEFQWNVSEYPDRNIVEKTEDIEAALQQAKANTDAPTVIEFIISSEELVLPMVKGGNPMNEMILK